ncbi:MAG TPA: DUF1295 domain-containing protein [Pirellulales bacterium]|nr:DUF1295 domain-containing protein [Pirellulales bacterium]HWB12984.1 DUF1295 domain-containing protein [Pirellulales bacterium]
MLPLSSTLLACFRAIMVCMLALWGVGTLRRDVSVVDPFWPAGFVLVVWIAWLMNAPVNVRPALLVGLTTLWGLRLAAFLLWRRRGHGEDRRYAAMRARHGSRFWRVSLVTVFGLQGVLLWFVSLPLQVAARGGDSLLGPIDVAGITIWAIGFVFEAVGDAQLARFQADPGNAGQVLSSGLWRWTRHPNYFGDFCVWWGLWLIAAAGGAWWTIGSPLVMTFLLLKVSGVALLESTIVDRRPDYAAYQARTNAFFPGRPAEGDARHRAG